MANVEITLIRWDLSSEKILRPLHRVGGGYAVTYKRRKWKIDNQRRIDLRSAKPLPESAVARIATGQEATELVQDGGTNGSKQASPEPRVPASPPPSSSMPLLVVVPANDPKFDDLDSSQKVVAEQPSAVRQLVDAGPGTGKTAVACSRIEWLVKNEKVPPAQIWLISFTRTAVHEIRERVTRLLNRSISKAVQMATLDSMAWQLHSGINRTASISGSFDDNIRALHGELEDNRNVEEYLGELRHLVIDEAQDIVGVRADLLLALIEKLPASCGVTVFADEAQAIYGFAAGDQGDEDDVHDGMEPELTLPRRIRDLAIGHTFVSRVLDQVHRTTDANLKTIFTQVRLEVLEPSEDALERNRAVRERLGALLIVRRRERSKKQWPAFRMMPSSYSADGLRQFAPQRRCGGPASPIVFAYPACL